MFALLQGPYPAEVASGPSFGRVPCVLTVAQALALPRSRELFPKDLDRWLWVDKGSPFPGRVVVYVVSKVIGPWRFAGGAGVRVACDPKDPRREQKEATPEAPALNYELVWMDCPMESPAKLRAVSAARIP